MQCAAVWLKGIIGGAEEEWAVLGNTKPWCLDFSCSPPVIILHKVDCNLHKKLRKFLMALNAEVVAPSSCYWWSGHRLSVQRCMMRGCVCRGRWRSHPGSFSPPFSPLSLCNPVWSWGCWEIIDQNIAKGSTDWGIEYLNLIGCFNLINTTFVQTSLPWLTVRTVVSLRMFLIIRLKLGQ